MIQPPIIIKVGGSLFDLPNLRPLLQGWLDARQGWPLVLVPGGGAAADGVRDLDRRHSLGEEKAHWLALRAMTGNAWFLAALLRPGLARVIRDREECGAAWEQGMVSLLDAHAFAEADEGRPGCLPHSWKVTSDSLAARVAIAWGSSRLILLKSTYVPSPIAWMAASAAGFVDPYFPTLAGALPLIEVVNFRDV